MGEKKTLRSVARPPDIWNAQVSIARAPHNHDVLRAHCDAEGRDFDSIELTYNCKMVIRDDPAEAQRVLDAQFAANFVDPGWPDDSFWAGNVEQIAERLGEFVALGFHTFTIEQLAPFDRETIERLIGEVKPILERG